MTDPRTLGELIRERRLARGLSLGQLATAVGRTAATVRSWERGQHFPAADVIERLSASLGIDADEIEAFMFREPPSLTVISDESLDDAVASESTSVSGEVSVETADGEGDDDTVEVGVFESAPASAAETEASFAAGSADELGVMPRIEPVASPAEPAAAEPAAAEPELVEPEPVEPAGADDDVDPGGEAGLHADDWVGDTARDEALADDLADQPVVPDPDAGAIQGIQPAAAALADDRESALIDEPTEAIGPPIVAPEPAAPMHVGVAVRAETLREPALPPFLAPLRNLFDPHKKWLYWIRGSLTVVVMLVMLVVLGWAAGQLFDGLGEVLDTIESTDTVLSGLSPAG